MLVQGGEVRRTLAHRRELADASALSREIGLRRPCVCVVRVRGEGESTTKKIRRARAFERGKNVPKNIRGSSSKKRDLERVAEVLVVRVADFAEFGGGLAARGYVTRLARQERVDRGALGRSLPPTYSESSEGILALKFANRVVFDESRGVRTMSRALTRAWRSQWLFSEHDSS